jgi:hypothetical protein
MPPGLGVTMTLSLFGHIGRRLSFSALPGEKYRQPIDKGGKFCEESGWSHIKHDRKSNAATLFHHMIVCPYVVTKTEEEPGK